MNRKRIKGETDLADCEQALNTLFRIVYTMVLVTAPFTPFLTEFMFQRLRKLVPRSKENQDSVHYQMIPTAELSLINEKIERSISSMQTVIELGRVIRDRKTLPLKYPLPEIVIIHQDPVVLEEIVSLKSYILDELNVKNLVVTTDKDKYKITLRAEPDHKTLGARLKGEFKKVTAEIKQLSDAQLQDFVAKKEIEVLGHRLEEQDIRLMFNFAAEELAAKYEAHSEGNVLVLLDITPDESMMNEGLAREIINRVQKLRKKAKLVPSDEAVAYYSVKDSSSTLAKVVVSHKEFIENITKTAQKPMTEMPKTASIILRELQNVKGVEMDLVLVGSAGRPNEIFAPFVNLKLVGYEARSGGNSDLAMVLLATFDEAPLTYPRLKIEIERIFGIHQCPYVIYKKDKKVLGASENLMAVNGQTLFVVRPGQSFSNEDHLGPACKFVNVQRKSDRTSVVLENPKGNVMSSNDLSRLLRRLKIEAKVPEEVLDLHAKVLG